MNRRVVIVSAHFPPSNLVSVHRARLISNNLNEFGWEPTIICVNSKYYEEPLDFDLEKSLNPLVKVIRVGAISQKIARSLRWGDIGLRSFFNLLFSLLKLARSKKIDLIFITIPSNYLALLGRLVFEFHQVPYIIDYQDPWVNETSQSEKIMSKAWLTQNLAKLLEPFALKKVSAISGMTPKYFESVIERNPHLKCKPKLSFQMGFASSDYEMLEKLKIVSNLVPAGQPFKQIVYAGALLPKAVELMRCFLKALSIVNNDPSREFAIRFVCIGTGSSSVDPKSYRILPLAKSVQAEKWVAEFPNRHPFFEVLASLKQADGIIIIGSTEPHYSPSKLFQAVFSKNPVLAVLHQDSEAIQLIKKSQAGFVCSITSDFNEEELIVRIVEILKTKLLKKQTLADLTYFDRYKGSAISEDLADFFNKVFDSV
jgi:hypothetical protein